MNKFVLRQSFLLLLAAFIWGLGFVAQSVGMDYVGPFTFNCAKCLIGGFVLLPFIAVSDYKKKKQENYDSKKLVIGGMLCGLILFFATSLQQTSLLYTTVGKAGFITSMYIIIVPIIGIFFKKKAGLRVWIAVVLSVIGLYFLCMTSEGFQLQYGDFLVLLCAITYSFHIIVIDHFAPLVNGVKMSCIQFFTCGILSGISMFLFETPKMTLIFDAWQPILYAGALSCGIGYTLQIVGQKGMNPMVASLIMSMEAVVSALAGWILLGQTLSSREIIGCLLMFTAIILVQIPIKKSQID